MNTRKRDTKPEVARFVEEMLGRLRRDFYPSEKRFYQDHRDLIQAITWPAKWMNQRGVEAPASLYCEILSNVIKTIQSKGDVAAIRRFSIYFLHSVQEHMRHHGDGYYYRAKAARPISSVLPSVTRNVGAGRPVDLTTDILAQVSLLVRSRGGRRRKIQSGQASLPLDTPRDRQVQSTPSR